MERLIIRREDGTSVGNFRARSEGKPVSEVLNFLKRSGQDGLLFDGDTSLTDADLLTPGQTYTFRPTTHAPSPGREDGLTSESVLTALEQVRSEVKGMSGKMKDMSGWLQESLSRTRAASAINAADISNLRHCLDITVIYEEEVVTVAELLGAETQGLESFWDGYNYEVQMKEMYTREFKRMINSRDVIWCDATGMECKVRFTNAEFPVTAKNDLVLSLRHYQSEFQIGAILGVEIKRELTWSGMRQAETEFYVWSYESQFPFIQLITDMEHGGVAIYSKGGSDVRFRTLESMEALRAFVSDVGKHLSPGFGKDEDSNGKLLNIDTLPEPLLRKRFIASNLGMGSTVPQPGSSSIGRQMTFWRMLAAYNNNLEDVANLRDLDCFDVQAVH